MPDRRGWRLIRVITSPTQSEVGITASIDEVASDDRYGTPNGSGPVRRYPARSAFARIAAAKKAASPGARCSVEICSAKEAGVKPV